MVLSPPRAPNTSRAVEDIIGIIFILDIEEAVVVTAVEIMLPHRIVDISLLGESVY